MSAQLSLTYAAARDEGIQRSAGHAESLESGWGASAYRVLCEYADSPYLPEGKTFTSEDFRDFLASIDFPVPVPKALGAVFQKAARNRVIERAGFGISKARHLSPCPLWRAK